MNTIALVDYFKPFYYFFITTLSILLIVVLFRKNLVNGFSILVIPFICVVVSAMLLYLEGIIVDAMVLDGDPFTFNMFFIVIGLSVVNLFVYSYRNRAK
jgi:hypothetical protein